MSQQIPVGHLIDLTLAPNEEVENVTYTLAPGGEAFVELSNQSDAGCTLGGLAAGVTQLTVTADRILGPGEEPLTCVIDLETYEPATDLGCQFSEPYTPE